MEQPKPENIDQYIANFPVATQKLLQQVRETIHLAVPQAKEVISYGMPAFKQKGILVYFAGYAKHIGFYPTGSGIEAFKDEFSGYKWSKGAVQFPLNKPLPLELIKRITQFKAERDLQKASKKK
ncbi:iron chaperone [Pedobacter vanadiisoli]|uniref:Iron chaperone n=1 Tax=Pedobacter vanadiisoli TaxID=1761975 RepID=A0ABW5MMY8_9SPHI